MESHVCSGLLVRLCFMPVLFFLQMDMLYPLYHHPL